MIEFNEDGSLKLPERLEEKKKKEEFRMQKGRCVHIRKEQVSFDSPKKCVLHLKLSEAIIDNRFVDTTYKYFSSDSEVPSKIIKINEKEFDIEIGTCFRRCTDCCDLIRRFREFLDGNVIEEKGSCTFEARAFGNPDFCYEDMFE
ncbi:MAG: hypothetical protein QF824_04485 [Candidatus Woesearchaeota archaeon]|jgi:hypothetical protein|nr:hypothetical protein [Candidatus Woesearchaeota archaeon]